MFDGANFNHYNSAMQDDEFVLEEDGETGKDKLKKLREELKQTQKEKDEYLTGWQRAKADLINARKDMDTQLRERGQFANRELIVSLLPVLDSFESAVGGNGWQEVDPKWRSGVEMIHTQLLSVLRANGAEPFDPTGEAFNPNDHEPMQMILPTNDIPSDHIAQTLQKGWRLNGKVIRPAKVIVTE